MRDDRDPPKDLFEAASLEASQQVARYREMTAKWLGQFVAMRERLRAEVGEISGSPLLLQMSGSDTVALAARGGAEPCASTAPRTRRRTRRT